MNYNKKYAFSLSTHQFRVRHLQGIQVRNLTSYTTTQLKILHPTHKHVIYSSTVYQASSNPQWVLQSSLGLLQSSRDLIVQIWDDTAHRLLIEQFITLAALSYLSEKNSTELQQVQHTPNSVLLMVHDTLFYSTHGVYPDIGLNVSLEEHEIKKPYVNVKSGDTRVSYDSHSVYRLHSRYKSVEETRSTISHIKRLAQDMSTVTPQDKIIDLKCRITSLRDKHSKFSSCLGKEVRKLESVRDTYDETCNNRNMLKSRLRRLQNSMSEELDKIDWKIKYTVKSKSKLLRRRQKLVEQLQDVFPIENNGINREIKICGVGISDQIGDRVAEEELGPALGYTTHVVNLISSILDIPLRFPLTPALSLSTVRDDITEKLDEKRVLPLYIRGKDRFYFNYGIFLLNRNIAQLRHQCGLKTDELKETLLNLQSLMEAKLQGNMSAHPPARLVSNDKIIYKHKRKDPFTKTHKRVRSAPISYSVSRHHGIPGMFDDTRISHSNVPSVVSSWSSQHSVGLGSMDKITSGINDSGETSSVEEVTVTNAPTPGYTPPLSRTGDSEKYYSSNYSPSPSASSDHPEHLYGPADRDSGPQSPDSHHEHSPRPSSSQSKSPYCSSIESDMINVTIPRSSPTISKSPRTSRSGRSSFKSYVRGSELWGRSEAGQDIARNASFKSYRDTRSTPTTSETSSGTGTASTLPTSDTRDTESSSPYQTTSTSEPTSDLTSSQDDNTPSRSDSPHIATIAKPDSPQIAGIAKPDSPQIAGIAKPDSPQIPTIAKPDSPQIARIAKADSPQIATIAKPDSPQIATIAKPDSPQLATIAKPDSPQIAGIANYATKSVSTTQYYSTKRYMALDSPITIRSPQPTNHLNHHYNNHATFHPRTATQAFVMPLPVSANTSPDISKPGSVSVTPDLCPVEILE